MPTLADTLNQPHPSHHHRSGTSIQFSVSDRFFSKLLSKDQSINNPSFRVYYGGSTGSIPFVWETAPGTPKHGMFLDEAARLPPLTPPPGFDNSNSNNTLGRRRSVGGDSSVSSSSRRSLVDGILQRLRSSSKSKADVAPAIGGGYLTSSPSSNNSSEWSGSLLAKQMEDGSCRRRRGIMWRSLSMRSGKREEEASTALTGMSLYSTLRFCCRRETSNSDKQNMVIKNKSSGKNVTSFGGCFRA